MNCKCDRDVLARVTFVKIFLYKVMLLGTLHDNEVFVQLAQMFAATQLAIHILSVCWLYMLYVESVITAGVCKFTINLIKKNMHYMRTLWWAE